MPTICQGGILPIIEISGLSGHTQEGCLKKKMEEKIDLKGRFQNPSNMNDEASQFVISH